MTEKLLTGTLSLNTTNLRKLILQMRIRSHPVGLDVMWGNSEGSGETVRMCRLAWAIARRLCDKYYNLMSWLLYDWDT